MHFSSKNARLLNQKVFLVWAATMVLSASIILLPRVQIPSTPTKMDNLHKPCYITIHKRNRDYLISIEEISFPIIGTDKRVAFVY